MGYQLRRTDKFSYYDCLIEFNHMIYKPLKIASKWFKQEKKFSLVNAILVTENDDQIFRGLATCYDLSMDVRLMPPQHFFNEDNFFNSSPSFTRLRNIKYKLQNHLTLTFLQMGHYLI